ncbi:MAG TPA: DUF420 domain-containing protein [Candidatus Limnocylindrales bacterium]|nr:DUF420 domain-containing protein [Candidatus Limnocylindrales bacterium]
MDQRSVFTGIGLVSAAIFGFLVWIIYLRAPAGAAGVDVSHLPALNAAFNSMSALCLLAGYAAARRRAFDLHALAMLLALGFSGLFLASYVVYHWHHGDTRFTGQGLVRPVYFFILVSHILLTMAALPMILTTVYYAAGRRFVQHRRLARWTLPIWLYVSVTGVLIFVFLRVWS